MEREDIILILGLGFIAYWMLKKNPTIIDNSTPTQDLPEKIDIEDIEPKKTVVLDMRPKMTSREAFYAPFRKSYDASKFATVAPPMVTIS